MDVKSRDFSKDTLTILAEQIIRPCLNLEPGRVVLYNQKWKIPPDDGMYIVLGYQQGRPYGASTRTKVVEVDGKFMEQQYTPMNEIVTINIFSKNDEALRRKEEVIMALQGIQSQKVQEIYNMRIAKIPSSILDISAVEGMGRITRYLLTLNIFRTYYKESEIKYYYDDFSSSIVKDILTEP